MVGEQFQPYLSTFSIGVLVQQEQDDLILLSEKIRDKIKKFKENAQPKLFTHVTL